MAEKYFSEKYFRKKFHELFIEEGIPDKEREEILEKLNVAMREREKERQALSTQKVLWFDAEELARKILENIRSFLLILDETETEEDGSENRADEEMAAKDGDESLDPDDAGIEEEDPELG